MNCDWPGSCGNVDGAGRKLPLMKLFWAGDLWLRGKHLKSQVNERNL